MRRVYLFIVFFIALGCDDGATDVEVPDVERGEAGSSEPLDSGQVLDGASEDIPPIDAQPEDSALVDVWVEPDIGPVDARPEDSGPDVAPVDAAELDDLPPIDAELIEDMAVEEDTLDAEPEIDQEIDAAPDVFINPCPDDRLPEPEICDGIDNDCNGAVDDGLGLAEPCQALGRCGGGFLECDDEGGLRCSTSPEGSLSLAIEEICNGEDDDCDGEIDEDPETLAMPCYSGPAGTLGVGACQGGFRLCEEGRLGACLDERVPQEERCDGLDNDCDDEIDEDYQPIEICGEGACRAGSVPSQCLNGVEIPCQPGAPLGADDDCDGVDQNCDGVADDGFVVTERCGLGSCQATATPSSCVNGAFTPCIPGVAGLNDTGCDGIDDDCDGEADEDYLPDSNCGRGVCRQEATPSSCVDGVEVACAPGSPAAEDLCDGLDNDCDGELDEDYVDETCGEGLCVSTSRCTNGRLQECRALFPEAQQDLICDGLDEDCDGEVDEDYQPIAGCGVGLCVASSTPSSCSEGVEIPCQPGAPAAQEDLICDGLDEDCDGLADEDIAQVIEDVCDGIDDDCDQLIDEDVVPFATPELRLTHAAGSSSFPRLSALGAGFQMVWSDNRESQGALDSRVYFTALNIDGATRVAVTPLSSFGGDHYEPDLAWGGDNAGLVAWHTFRGVAQIVYRRIDGDGGLLGDEELLATPEDARSPRVAFNQGVYGLIWTGKDFSNQQDIYFARVGEDGVPIGDPLLISARPEGVAGRASVPNIVAAGAGFAVIYADLADNDVDLYFQKINAAGQLDGARVAVSDGPRSSNFPSIAPVDGGFVVAWYDLRDRNNEIYTARLDPDGAKIGDDHRITQTDLSSTNPSLYSDGAHVGLVWQELIPVNNHEVFFQWLNNAGAPLGARLQLSDADGGSFAPHLTRNGGRFFSAWYDLRDASNREIYGIIGSFGCPPD